MNKTKIDWCDSTWNPVTGCLHGCEYCYARCMVQRFGPSRNEKLLGALDAITEYSNDVYNRMMFLKAPFKIQNLENGKQRACPYPFGFVPTFHAYRLGEYARKVKSRNIFVCSMADLFGKWVPEPWIKMVFEDCKAAPQHNYLFLTKNPNRYIDLDIDRKLPLDDNFWFGTSVTRSSDTRTWFARREKHFHWFLSVEPILEDIGTIVIDGEEPEWVIVGAETGNRKDKVIADRRWIENLVEECRKYGIPIFMKSSLGEIWEEPLIQEFPAQLRKGGENEVRS